MLARFQGRELEPDEKGVIEGIESSGWTVMTIKDEPGQPGWSYTIGLFENYHHPEVIIFGMEADNRHRILNWIGENVKEGKPFTATQEHDWVLKNYKCWSRQVQQKWYHDLLGYAMWFYDRQEFPCTQALWPDKDGTYPWQPEYAFADQPLLYEEDLITARMMHWASSEKLTKEQWPFSCEPHTRTFVSRCVAEDGAPIVRATRDHGGDWQFIGPVEDPNKDGCRIVCFHCIVERDPSVKLLAGLSPGFRALRDKPSDAWRLEAVEREDESQVIENT